MFVHSLKYLCTKIRRRGRRLTSVGLAQARPNDNHIHQQECAPNKQLRKNFGETGKTRNEEQRNGKSNGKQGIKNGQSP